MVLARPLVLSRAPLAALCAIGLFWGAFAAMLPQIKAALGVSDAGMGGLLFLSAAGALTAMALAPWMSAQLPRTVLPLSGLALAAAIVAIGAGSTPLLFAFVILAIGMATGCLDVLGNARISTLEARHQLSLMNLNHAGYSFAYALSAAVTGLVREAGWPPAFWFAQIAFLALLLVPIMALDRPARAGAQQSRHRGPVPVAVWIAGLIVLIAFFAENATEGWSALHIERTLGGRAAEGAFGPAMLGLTMGIGRLAGHFITPRGAELRVIGIAATLSAAGLAIAAIAPFIGLAYLGFALLGFGISVIGPLALALAGQAADDKGRELAVSRAAMVGYTGFFIGPPMMGLVSEAFGLRAAFGAAALMLGLILLLLPRLKA